MATVTFPIELGGSGLVVSDDTDPTTGLRNGGYLTRFVPALQQTVAVAGFVVGQVSNAAASASAAAGSASAASSSASSAASSAASAATLYDQFDDRYLGPKASNPTVDNDGNALLVGAMYFNTAALETRVWNGTTWQTASVNGGTVNSLIVTGNFGVGTASAQFKADLNVASTSTNDQQVVLRLKSTTTADMVDGFGVTQLFSIQDNSGVNFNIAQIRAVRSGTDDSGSIVLAPYLGGAAIDRLIIGSSGNMSLGATLQTWLTNSRVLQMSLGAAFAGRTNDITIAEMSANQYINAAGSRVYLGSGAATLYQQTAGSHQWSIAPLGTAGNVATFALGMTLTNVGDLGLNTATPTVTGSYTVLDIVGRATNNGGMLITRTSNSSGIGRFYVSDTQVLIDDSGSTTDIFIKTNSSNNVLLGTSNIERARVTSGGYLKASNSGSYGGVAGITDQTATSLHVFQNDQNTATVASINGNTGSSVYNFGSFLATGAAGFHYQARLNNVIAYQVLANGNVQNTNNSYGAISDPKLKDIIGPKSSTWEKTKQYNWIEYYLKSDTEHTFKMLGLNAEEAQAVSPGVVDESPDLVEVTKVRQVPVQIVRLDENENPVVDEETGELIYDEVMVDEEYTEWEPNGEFTKSVKYSVVSMQYHRTTQECQERIEDLETAKVQTDDLIQQIMARVAALESASA